MVFGGGSAIILEIQLSSLGVAQVEIISKEIANLILAELEALDEVRLTVDQICNYTSTERLTHSINGATSTFSER